MDEHVYRQSDEHHTMTNRGFAQCSSDTLL